MRNLTFNDFEKYDLILNEKDEPSDQAKHWTDLKTTKPSDSSKVNSICGGSMPKIFARVKSSIMPTLFKELKNPDCHYVTYLNDFVKSNSQFNTPPVNRIGVLLKKTHIAQTSDTEELASLVANVLHVPTVFNKSVSIEGSRYVLSVDFMNNNEIFIPMLFCNNINEYTLEDCITLLETSLLNLEPKITKKDALKVCRDFIPIYFYRKHIIKDQDFCGKNIGLIYNKKTNSYTLAPSFDMECSYKYPMFDIAFDHLDCDIEFALQKHPETTQTMMNHFKSCFSTNAVASTLDANTLDCNKDHFKTFTGNNLSLIIAKYDQISKRQDKERSL